MEGTDAGSFTINTANGQLLTSAALDADTKATYTVDVVASDGSLEARITVTITVTATNMAPVFSEGASTTRTVSENAQASSPVGAPVTTDADNDTLVYSLDGTDASSFDITSSGGQLLVGAGPCWTPHEVHVLGDGRRKRREPRCQDYGDHHGDPHQ